MFWRMLANVARDRPTKAPTSATRPFRIAVSAVLADRLLRGRDGQFFRNRLVNGFFSRGVL